MKLYLYKFLVFMMIFYLMPESVLATSDSQNKALVYYQPFDTELYAPLSEDSIGEGICKYTIDEDVFINLFLSKESNRQLSLDYTHGNIIAKIIMPGEYKVFYFISREGIVRSVDDFFVIDKEKFQRSLVFVSCPDLEFFNKVLNIEFSYPKHFNLWIVGSDENSIKLLDATLVPLSYTKTGKLTKIIFDSKIAIEIDGIKIESRNSGIYINNEEIGNTSHISIDEYNNIKRDTYIINYQCDDNGLCRKDNFECE